MTKDMGQANIFTIAVIFMKDSGLKTDEKAKDS